ncbi:single-stranded DNA-binding protein [Galactobacter valiniphilus]|uniref:Single-stranded DNA-binding protein n=1 Tax=Galactobacter valiniphilus TaxID=2676122 RepID=A0A399JHI1_9MICC|nr:single-stranded DNA-binding protein [Galactobacter valiniphilus]RII41916.1 single-stranded DNA-binding protein [Galactobacter valiniphilus]
MAGETPVTVIGRLTADPELRFVPSGAAVANFDVASNARVIDKQANEWKDGPTTYWPCSVWRDQAEHVAQSLAKGMQVIVYGNIITRSWEAKDGGQRSRQEIDVQHVGPSLYGQEAQVTKAARGQGGSGFGGATPPASGGNDWGAPAQQNDPWGQPSGGSGGWPAAGQNEPPF